jgi:AcrR family transcriptional regulator
MSLTPEPTPQRRRGAVLEKALLDAAWAELNDRGYDEFTIDAVAARAGTSRAVLYRRWPGKHELVHAALVHAVGEYPVAAPDTGTLRGDVIAVLRQANERRTRLAVVLFTRLGGFYRETGTNLSELAAIVGDGRAGALDEVIERAIARGEVQPDQISERVARLPGDLFRHDLLMTLKPLTDEAIEEIVDMVFLPLVRLGAPGN